MNFKNICLYHRPVTDIRGCINNSIAGGIIVQVLVLTSYIHLIKWGRSVV